MFKSFKKVVYVTSLLLTLAVTTVNSQADELDTHVSIGHQSMAWVDHSSSQALTHFKMGLFGRLFWKLFSVPDRHHVHGELTMHVGYNNLATGWAMESDPSGMNLIYRFN